MQRDFESRSLLRTDRRASWAPAVLAVRERFKSQLLPGHAPGGAPSFLASPRKEGKRKRPCRPRPAELRAVSRCGTRCAPASLRSNSRSESEHESKAMLRWPCRSRPLRSSAQPEGIKPKHRAFVSQPVCFAIHRFRCDHSTRRHQNTDDENAVGRAVDGLEVAFAATQLDDGSLGKVIMAAQGGRHRSAVRSHRSVAKAVIFPGARREPPSCE